MKAIIEELLSRKAIDSSQLDLLKKHQSAEPEKNIIELLLELKLVSSRVLGAIAQKVYSIKFAALTEDEIDVSATKLIPYDLAKKYCIFPMRLDGEVLWAAISNPFDLKKMDDLRVLIGKRIKPFFASPMRIYERIDHYYQADDILQDSLSTVLAVAKKEINKDTEHAKGIFDIEELKSERSSVVRLVNLILDAAIKSKASDIHVEPQAKFLRIRFRVDGCMTQVMTIPNVLRAAVTARIKILTNLDISECRKTQDGRTALLIEGRKVDLRVSLTPTFYGEKAVLRLLDPTSARIDLDKIGFHANEKEDFIDCIRKPQGMVLLTGPTGCGKTSTLYAALNFLQREKGENIVTIEDPIEYLIDGVNQIQVNEVKNVNFANALRSILRQDPNVILVGEIRDCDTAQTAFRASLTGHLVFSTLHTRDTVSSITRLMDIGLEPYLISSSLLMIMAQRLVRKTCSHCQVTYEPDARLLQKFSIYIRYFSLKTFQRGKGCFHCGFSGFSGRKAIFEMCRITEKIREMIVTRVPEDAIMKEAYKGGMRSLAHAGMEQVALGMTTMEEVERIADVTEAEINSFQSKIRAEDVLTELTVEENSHIA